MKKPSLQTPQDRLEYVGTELYGKDWKTKLAAGLRISRSQLFEWRRGTPKTTRRDIDGELIALIDRQRGVADARRLTLSMLRTKLLSITGGSERDAA